MMQYLLVIFMCEHIKEGGFKSSDYVLKMKDRFVRAFNYGVRVFRWNDFGDDRVCEYCHARNGKTYKVLDVLAGREVMPGSVHNNCRCFPYFIPFVGFHGQDIVYGEKMKKNTGICESSKNIFDMPDNIYQLFYIVRNYKNYQSVKTFLMTNLEGEPLDINKFFKEDKYGNVFVNKGYYLAKLDLPLEKENKDKFNFHRFYYSTIDQLTSSGDDFFEYRKKGAKTTLLFFKYGASFYKVDNSKLTSLYNSFVKNVSKEKQNKEKPKKEDLTVTNTPAFVTTFAKSPDKRAYNIFKLSFNKEPESEYDNKIIKIIDSYLNNKREGVIDDIKRALSKWIKNPIVLGLIVWYIAKHIQK